MYGKGQTTVPGREHVSRIATSSNKQCKSRDRKLLRDFQSQLCSYKAVFASFLHSCKMPDITSNMKYFLEFTQQDLEIRTCVQNKTHAHFLPLNKLKQLLYKHSFFILQAKSHLKIFECAKAILEVLREGARFLFSLKAQRGIRVVLVMYFALQTADRRIYASLNLKEPEFQGGAIQSPQAGDTYCSKSPHGTSAREDTHSCPC